MATGTTRVNRVKALPTGVTLAAGTGDADNARTMAVYASGTDTTTYSVAMDKNTIVTLRRTSGNASATITIETPFSLDGLDLPDATLTVGTGADAMVQLGGFNLVYYADTDGDVNFRSSVDAQIEISAWTP